MRQERRQFEEKEINPGRLIGWSVGGEGWPWGGGPACFKEAHRTHLQRPAHLSVCGLALCGGLTSPLGGKHFAAVAGAAAAAAPGYHRLLQHFNCER